MRRPVCILSLALICSVFVGAVGAQDVSVFKEEDAQLLASFQKKSLHVIHDLEALLHPQKSPPWGAPERLCINELKADMIYAFESTAMVETLILYSSRRKQGGELFWKQKIKDAILEAQARVGRCLQGTESAMARCSSNEELKSKRLEVAQTCSEAAALLKSFHGRVKDN